MFMKSSLVLLSAILEIVLIGNSAFSQDKKESPASQPAESAKMTEQSKGLRTIAAASELIDYGRKNKVPEALIMAARLIGTTPTSQPDPKTDVIPKSDHPAYDAAKEAESLILEALKYDAPENSPVKMLASATREVVAERSKGRLGGAKAIPGSMRGVDDFDSFKITFVGGRVAEVLVRTSTRNADVDIRVIDGQTGRVVASDRRADDDCRVGWRPEATKQYVIEVRNFRQNINTAYTLFTN